jgi:hypothetical protein
MVEKFEKKFLGTWWVNQISNGCLEKFKKITLLAVAILFLFTFFNLILGHLVQIDWQWPFSSVHSIMMVNQPSLVSGGVCPPTFNLSTITCNVMVYAPIHSSYFSSTLFSSVVFPLLKSLHKLCIDYESPFRPVGVEG